MGWLVWMYAIVVVHLTARHTRERHINKFSSSCSSCVMFVLAFRINRTSDYADDTNPGVYYLHSVDSTLVYLFRGGVRILSPWQQQCPRPKEGSGLDAAIMQVRKSHRSATLTAGKVAPQLTAQPQTTWWWTETSGMFCVRQLATPRREK